MDDKGHFELSESQAEMLTAMWQGEDKALWEKMRDEALDRMSMQLRSCNMELVPAIRAQIDGLIFFFAVVEATAVSVLLDPKNHPGYISNAI